MADVPHYLLTVLGRMPRDALYTLGGQECHSSLAPAALIRMLPPERRPSSVLALCTPTAESNTFPTLKSLLFGYAEPRCVPVPSGQSQADVDTFLERVAQEIPAEEVRLTVDVTHGFRHFSFLTYVAVLYLEALQGVRVEGAYYGLFQEDGPSPFLDLKPLLKLPGWLYALRALEDTGSTRALARQLGGASSQIATRLRGRLDNLSVAFASGLPLELGREADRLLGDDETKPLRRLLRSHKLPRSSELVDRLTTFLEPLRIESLSDGWKGKVPLTEDELRRQARLVDQLLAVGNYAVALQLISEWTVSWALWCEGRTEAWLDYDAQRRRASNLLHAIAAVAGRTEGEDHLSPEQKRLGEFWNRLSELRNSFAHHGMRKQDLFQKNYHLDGIRRINPFWFEVSQCPRWSLSLSAPDAGTLLISPIGHRPGVLYSAVKACQTKGCNVTRCLAICSGSSEAAVTGALAKAGFAGEHALLRLEDPYWGEAETDGLLGLARPHVLKAAEVMVNVTGGTTFMGLLAQRLADDAARTGRPVCKFGLVDRRAPAEQDGDPYVEGEAFWLTSAPSASTAAAVGPAT